MFTQPTSFALVREPRCLIPQLRHLAKEGIMSNRCSEKHINVIAFSQ
jgi:hypothetical protein